VSARVRSLVVESYLGCGRCWLNTLIWPSSLSLDGRALVAASAQSAPSEVLIRYRSRPDIPTKVSWAWGARWRWDSLVPRDPPTPSQSPCYHSLVPTMGGCQALGPSRPLLGLRGGCGARLLKILIAIMNTKNSSTTSMSRQAKRSCPGSSDSDTDDSPPNFPRWLIIEAAEPERSLSKLSPFVLGKALTAQIGSLKSVKRLYQRDILVETYKATYS